MIIGVDPHKASHTATALDPATNTPVSSIRIDASIAGYRQLIRWAAQFEERRWAIENAKGLGSHLTQWLIARDEAVVDVATTATSRVRELSRGGRRKNDVIDASAAASVAALHGDATVATADDETTVFALLEERRANPAAQRVRTVNQLHALMRDLTAGGARVALSANVAAAKLRSVRPSTPTGKARKAIAWDLVRDIRALDRQLAAIADQMTVALDDYETSLLEVDGVGPVLATRLLGRTGRPRGSGARTRLPATPDPRPSKRPAVNALYTGFHAAVTASSTQRSTSSRSPRSACATAPGAPTSTARSQKARPAMKQCDASNASSPATSGGACSPTNAPASTATTPSPSPLDRTQRHPGFDGGSGHLVSTSSPVLLS